MTMTKSKELTIAHVGGLTFEDPGRTLSHRGPNKFPGVFSCEGSLILFCCLGRIKHLTFSFHCLSTYPCLGECAP